MDKWWKFVVSFGCVCGGAVYITMLMFGVIFLHIMVTVTDVLIIIVWLVWLFTFFYKMYTRFYEQS